MVDDVVVLGILREIEEGCSAHSCTPHDMSLDVEGDTLAALCRAWLAVQDAPTVAITECNQVPGEPDFDHGDMAAAVAGLTPGQRVRIVKEVGDD